MIETLRRFSGQASTPYRNFQIVAGLLFVTSVAAAVGWWTIPSRLIAGFETWHQWLGGGSVGRSALLQYVGVGYGAVVAFGLWWLMRDLRNRRGALVPVAFLIGGPALLEFGLAFRHGSLAAGLVSVGVVQSVASLALAISGNLAHADIRGRTDGVLIPKPVGPSLIGWMGFEERWMRSILAATLPPRPSDDQPGFDEAVRTEFWDRYAENVPLHFQLGLRAATWVVTFWPLLTLRSYRTFHGLPDPRRDEVLQSIERSNFFLVRQVTFVLKTTAGFGYFRNPEIQARFPTAYDLGDGPAEGT